MMVLSTREKGKERERVSSRGRRGGREGGEGRELEKLNAPREEVKMTSGFSAEVAMAVTHPPCPSRVPLKERDSDMS